VALWQPRRLVRLGIHHGGELRPGVDAVGEELTVHSRKELMPFDAKRRDAPDAKGQIIDHRVSVARTPERAAGPIRQYRRSASRRSRRGETNLTGTNNEQAFAGRARVNGPAVTTVAGEALGRAWGGGNRQAQGGGGVGHPPHRQGWAEVAGAAAIAARPQPALAQPAAACLSLATTQCHRTSAAGAGRREPGVGLADSGARRRRHFNGTRSPGSPAGGRHPGA